MPCVQCLTFERFQHLSPKLWGFFYELIFCRNVLILDDIANRSPHVSMFQVRLVDLGDEEGNAYIQAIVAANTWVQAELNPSEVSES